MNVDQLSGLVQQLQEDPGQGDTVWRAEVNWKDGFANQVHTRDLAPVQFDEPTQLGGTDTAPNPVEQLIGSLGSCLAIGYTANASVRGITVRDLHIELEGHIDLPVFLGLKPGNAGYPSVNVRVYLDAAALDELHQHVLRTSPVGNTITKPVEINAELVQR